MMDYTGLNLLEYDKELGRFLVSMPLIAQLGKNYNSDTSTSISGQALLEIACNKIQEAQFILLSQPL